VVAIEEQLTPTAWSSTSGSKTKPSRAGVAPVMPRDTAGNPWRAPHRGSWGSRWEGWARPRRWP